MKKKLVYSDDMMLAIIRVLCLAYAAAWVALAGTRVGVHGAVGMASIVLAGYMVGRHARISEVEKDLDERIARLTELELEKRLGQVEQDTEDGK